MVDTVLLKKILDWAKKTTEAGEVTEFAFNLLDFDENIPVVLEKGTKIEYSEEFVLIWEITNVKGDLDPTLINLERIISVTLA